MALKENINFKLDTDSWHKLGKTSKKLKVRMSTLVRLLVQRAIEDDYSENELFHNIRGFMGLKIPDDLPKTQTIGKRRNK